VVVPDDRRDRGGGPGATIDAMNPKMTFRLLLALSIAYGIAVAIMGALGSSALTIVAIVGALVIGGLWALRGVLSNRNRSA
jgi:hypothetical protein